MEIIYYYLVASVFPRFWHFKNKGCLMSEFLWRRKWQTLQYSCLENPMDRGAWWATVHGVTESDITEHTCVSGFSIMHRSWAVQSHIEILINIQNVVHWRRQWQTTSVFLPPEPHAAAKSLQSCPTLCDPTDGSPPGSPVPGILQARTLEWVAISFSNA